MDKFKRQAILLTLLDALRQRGSWCGETHIQKSAYFLEEGVDVPLGWEFVLYRHGPFSFDLSEDLGEMRANYLIDVESRYPYGPSLVPSEAGLKFAARFPKATEAFAPKVLFIADRLAGQNVNGLERLGTALYVRRELGDLPEQARAERIRQLKPHIPFEQALDAVQEVDRLLIEANPLKSAAAD